MLRLHNRTLCESSPEANLDSINFQYMATHCETIQSRRKNETKMGNCFFFALMQFHCILIVVFNKFPSSKRTTSMEYIHRTSHWTEVDEKKRQQQQQQRCTEWVPSFRKRTQMKLNGMNTPTKKECCVRCFEKSLKHWKYLHTFFHAYEMTQVIFKAKLKESIEKDIWNGKNMMSHFYLFFTTGKSHAKWEIFFGNNNRLHRIE